MDPSILFVVARQRLALERRDLLLCRSRALLGALRVLERSSRHRLALLQVALGGLEPARQLAELRCATTELGRERLGGLLRGPSLRGGCIGSLVCLRGCRLGICEPALELL